MLCVLVGLLTRSALPWVGLGCLCAIYLLRKVREGCFSIPSWRTYYRVPLVLLTIHIGTLAGIVRGNLARLNRRDTREAP
jgi:hypothetical protein